MIAELPVSAALACAGAIVGSFLAVLLVRWPAGESVIAGRSRCDGCRRTLAPAELVPLLSWILLRGRCRGCEARIDTRHVAMELGAVAIGLVAAIAHVFPLSVVTALLGWWLLILAALDAEHHWLPDALTLPLIPVGLVVALCDFGPPLEDRLIGTLAGFAILALIAFAYRRLRGREGLGGGDPKLLAALGAWLGWQQLPFVLLGAGLVGLAYLAGKLALGRAVSGSDSLPLGTLMAVAAWPLWLVAAS